MWDTVFPVSTGVDSDCARSLSRVVVLSMVAITFVLGAGVARAASAHNCYGAFDRGGSYANYAFWRGAEALNTTCSKALAVVQRYVERTNGTPGALGRRVHVGVYVCTGFFDGRIARIRCAAPGGRRVSFYGATPAPDPGARLSATADASR